MLSTLINCFLLWFVLPIVVLHEILIPLSPQCVSDFCVADFLVYFVQPFVVFYAALVQVTIWLVLSEVIDY